MDAVAVLPEAVVSVTVSTQFDVAVVPVNCVVTVV
jgi:hypothetical protein